MFLTHLGAGYYIYTTTQNFGIGSIFNVFKEDLLTKAAFI